MDTSTAKIDVSEQLNTIKAHMPETYNTIKARAAVIGNDVYTLVRQGLRGEPNCFWAMEKGWVMGAPFNMEQVQQYTAWAMVSFGCAYACTFGFTQAQLDQLAEANNGTH